MTSSVTAYSNYSACVTQLNNYNYYIYLFIYYIWLKYWKSANSLINKHLFIYIWSLFPIGNSNLVIFYESWEASQILPLSKAFHVSVGELPQNCFVYSCRYVSVNIEDDNCQNSFSVNSGEQHVSFWPHAWTQEF